jgi:hypothetical protein
MHGHKNVKERKIRLMFHGDRTGPIICFKFTEISRKRWLLTSTVHVLNQHSSPMNGSTRTKADIKVEQKLIRATSLN